MPGRRWGRCCLRAAWPFRGAPELAMLVLLGRRFVSKFEGAEGWLEEGEWLAVGGADERDLPRDEDVEVIMRSRKAWEQGRCELLELKYT